MHAAMISTRLLFVGFLALAACGGIDENKKISELTADEKKTLCEESVSAQGTEPKDCGNGFTFTPKSQADCESTGGTSSCTVKQVRACNDALGGDVCKILATPECTALVQCSG